MVPRCSGGQLEVAAELRLNPNKVWSQAQVSPQQSAHRVAMSLQYSLAAPLPPLPPLPRPGPGLAARARRVRHAADPALAPAPARAVVRRVQVRVPALVLRVAVRVLLTNQR